MQFSIIVEGPMESNGDDEALLELERFLRASDISPTLLQQLKKGSPQILKNELTYEQAVKISDRLIDLGLDSIIDPPIKPDDDDDDIIPEAQKVTNIKQASQPKNSRTSSVKTVRDDNNKQSFRNVSVANKSSAMKKPNTVARKPSLAVVNSVANAKKPVRHVPEMAKVAVGKTSNSNGLQNKSVQNQSQPHPSQQQSSKVSAKIGASNIKPPQRPTPQQSAPQASKVSTPLAQAATEVKSLFQLPKDGALNITTPVTSRLKLILGAIVCVTVPAVYAAIWLSFFYLSLSLSITLFSSIGGFLLFPLPILIISGVFALCHLPYYYARHEQQPEIIIRAKDEPRLFMLVSAIGKILNTPTPTAIALTDSTELNVQQDSSVKDYFSFKQALTADLKISIGADLIQCLSIRNISALIAKHMGVFANDKLRRPLLVILTIKSKVKFASTPHDQLQQRLRTLHDNTSIAPLQKVFGVVATASDRLHRITCGYFSYSLGLINACTNAANKVGELYLQAFLGEDGQNQLEDALVNISANHELAHEDMLVTNAKKRFINNLPEYCHYLLEKNRGKQATPEVSTASSGIVRSGNPMQGFIDGFQQYAKLLTRQVYEQAGLNFDQIELCTLQGLFQREAKDQKFTQAADEYFMDWLHPFQFWRLPADSSVPKEGPAALVTRLNNCIARIRYIAPDRQSWLNRFDKLLKEYAEVKAAKKVLASGNRFEFQRCGDSATNLEQGINLRKAQIKEAQDELRQHNALMGERLTLGLLLNEQQKELCTKLHQALAACSGVGERATNLVSAVEELNQILRNKPKNQSQQYQLYIRELSQLVSDNDKAIRKRLMQCPYDFIDRRYPTMAQFISSQQSEYDSLNMGQEELIINKARDTLAAINWSYKQLSQRAAFIASAMEKQFNVEKVKKID